MDQLPGTARDLVHALADLVPPRCIRPGETVEEAHRYAGKRELVEFLLRLVEESEARSPDAPITR